MDATKATSIFEALASGCSPTTGQLIENDSVLGERDVIRALQFAIDELSDGKKRKPVSVTDDENKFAYRQVDFFRQDTFNTMSEELVERFRKSIGELELVKSDNLPEYQAKARLKYARAYEPWSAAERELFSEAIQHTNDLDLLSSIFQRGKGSVETFGQKFILESQEESASA